MSWAPASSISSGILEMDAPGFDHAKRARASAEQHGIEFEWIDADEIRKRWPAFDPPDSWEGGFSPLAGFLDIEAGLAGLAAIAKRGDVTFRTDEPVLSWSSQRRRRRSRSQRKADTRPASWS